MQTILDLSRIGFQKARSPKIGTNGVSLQRTGSSWHKINPLPAAFPCVALSFDDLEDTIFTVAYPLMSSRGFKGTVFVPTNQIGTTNKLTAAQITTLYNAGWDISCNGTANDTAMTGAADMTALINGINKVKQTLRANGWRNSTEFMCYPTGAFQAGTLPTDPFYGTKVQDALLAAGYIFGRTTQGGGLSIQHGFGGRELTFPGIGFSAVDAAAAYTSFSTNLTTAINTGLALYPYFHRILPGGSANGSINVDTTAFTQMLDLLAAEKALGHIDVCTTSELFLRHCSLS